MNPSGKRVLQQRHADVKMFTLSEGEISELHVGLKGTMNALFLKDLADKTRRGQRGRIEAGKSGGGNSYGNGEAVRGDRTINPVQAEVVRRIFRDYAAGKSAKRIAVELNREGVAAPSGGDWGFSTINGNQKRGNGILNNEMYIGKLVWNRQRFIKDLDTSKRQARPNPESEWVIQEAPGLRIVEDDMWNAVEERQKTVKHERRDDGEEAENHFRDRRRPKYLLSGLTRCGCCGGGYSMISSQLIGCSTRRNKGTCENNMNIRRDALEARVLNALRHNLMQPELFREFCEEFTREMNRLRMEGRASIDAAEAEIRKIDRELETLLNLILKGGAADMLNAKMVKLERRQKELKAFLAEAEEPPPLLHPNMAHHYRLQVEDLYAALQEDSEARRMEATGVPRSLVKEIVLTPDPESGELLIEVRGDLAGILAISLERKKPSGGEGCAQFEMVAGACNHLKLRLLSAYRTLLEQSALAGSRGLLRSAAYNWPHPSLTRYNSMITQDSLSTTHLVCRPQIPQIGPCPAFRRGSPPRPDTGRDLLQPLEASNVTQTVASSVAFISLDPI